MNAIVYYKTRHHLRHCICESPKEMWRAIHKVLGRGHTVTEIDVHNDGDYRIYTLGFTAQGEPVLRWYK